jgi:hypothetical protein
MTKERTQNLSAVLSIVGVLITLLAAIYQRSPEYGDSARVVLLMGLAAFIAAISAALIIPTARRKRKPEAGHVFLIYANEDAQRVEQLYAALQKEGFKPWMAAKDILPGQPWESSIRKAIERADIALACFSHNAAAKNGFVQKELKYALDLMEEKKEGISPVIPVRLEETTLPDRLKHLQWLDLFTENGFEQLFKTLKVATGVA